MSDSEILLKAVFNRISARISEKLIKSAEELAGISKDMPQKLKDEWESFKDEVIEESDRLGKDTQKTNSASVNNSKPKASREDLIQIKIDKLRSKVIDINKTIEEIN